MIQYTSQRRDRGTGEGEERIREQVGEEWGESERERGESECLSEVLYSQFLTVLTHKKQDHNQA